MSVRIRLVPHGRKKRRTYRIRSGERRKLTGRYVEELGWYDPAAGEGEGVIWLRRQAYLQALNNGAQPSVTLESLVRRGTRGAGPILQLIPEEARDLAGGPLVEVPIMPQRESNPVQALLRIPDPLAGDRTAPVDHLITRTPVAQFVLRRDASEVMTVFVDIEGQDSEWARASFRWKTGVSPRVVWTEALAFLQDAAAGAAAYVSFESDGELLEPAAIDWLRAGRELDGAVMALRSVKRIHLFTAGTEITIESAPRGHILAVAVRSQSLQSPAGRQAVLSLLDSTVAENRGFADASVSRALEAVAARARPAVRARAGATAERAVTRS